MLGSGGSLVLDTSTPGKLAGTGITDDWTFFGRAGQAVTVVVGTGSAAHPRRWVAA